MTTRDPKFSALFYLLALVILFANGESEARQENGRYGQTAGTLPPRSVQVYGETLPFRASSLDPAVKSILARLKLRRTADSRNEKYEDPKGSVELTFDGNHQLRSVSYFSGQPVMGDKRHHQQYSGPLPFIGKAFPLAERPSAFPLLRGRGGVQHGRGGDSVSPSVSDRHEAIARAQQRTRHRALKVFERRAVLSEDVTKLMLRSSHSGGVSLNAEVWVPSWERAGLECLLRYRARPDFTSERPT